MALQIKDIENVEPNDKAHITAMSWWKNMDTYLL